MSPIGIDTGGTFTDFIWIDASGALRLHKQPSTPDDPSRAVLAGLAESDAPAAADIVHGSTVATNALLERRGARTALIATVGFADVLAIGRQNRPDLYALVPQKPPPLVPNRWRFEAHERVDAAGQVIAPLNEAALAQVLEQIATEAIESVAVCLLFSFLRPEHERRIGAALAVRLGSGVHVSLSSDILPEYREYERTATTVINAYVAPLMGRYLARLAERLAPRRLAIMQSNGSIISAGLAGTQAARTALSGPAAGVVGARFVAGRAGREGAGFPDIITFDMGGTSTDVALCPGRTPTTTEAEIAGLPLRLPIIDIHTVGAGGGSLAYRDAGGALRVGPESAGASPGPACYHADVDAWRVALARRFTPGRATVTDANLVLGRLDAGRFLGGHMALYEASARSVLDALAAELDTTVEAAALAVIRVANATMERAIRRISVERGHDPRRFVLVAFGGGGPLHACELAEALRIPTVLIPMMPGVLSALGMLVTPPSRDTSQTVMRPLAGDAEVNWLDDAFWPLAGRVRQEMAAEGHDPATLALRHALDMRYVGQAHELTIGHQPGRSAADIAAAFHDAHAARYGYARPDAALEIVTLRLAAEAQANPPAMPAITPGTADATPARIGARPVWFTDGVRETALYDRERLLPGHRLAGPAIVYQYDTTTAVLPGWSAWVDGQRNLLLSRATPLASN